MRLLFCQLRNHGDIIRTFPMLEAIKHYHPEWKIGFTCYPDMVETCSLCNCIDSIIPQKRFMPVTDTQGGTRILDCSILSESIERVRAEKYDVYIDLHGIFQSAVFGALCDIKKRLGRSKETAKDGASYFYTDICEIAEREINRMERHFTVLNKMFPDVHPLISERTRTGDYVLIFPGSSMAGNLKRWNKEKYKEVGMRLCVNHKVRYVIGPEESELSASLHEIKNCDVVSIISWKQAVNEINNSKLVIGNDGAYLHISIWKNIPTIMICGPTSPVINGVWRYGTGITISSLTNCKSCNAWGGICDKDNICMKSISVDDVMGEIEKYV
jgi:hypothetical protein